MHCMTTNDADAREQPRFGALEGMGAFVGLADDVLPEVVVPQVADAGDAGDAGDIGDAGEVSPPMDLVVPDGCNCNEGGGAPGGGWMLVLGLFGVGLARRCISQQR